MYFVLAYRLRKKKEFLFVQSRRYNHQICTTYYILTYKYYVFSPLFRNKIFVLDEMFNVYEKFWNLKNHACN